MLDRVVPDSVIPAALVDVLVGPGSIPGAPSAGLQPAANARGVLARRSGVTPEQVAGTGWDIALGVSRIVLWIDYNCSCISCTNYAALFL